MAEGKNAQERERDSIEKILAEFDAKREILEAFCQRTKNLIEECLKDAGIRYQSIQARPKSRDKLREKYLDPAKNYRILDDITDQAALRVITYYEDEVDRVADVIKREFEIDMDRSVDKRDAESDRFGYYALNYICRHVSKRRADVEYKKFADICCEIQVTSILRHAWSEIEHPWYDLKDAYPEDIKRRFYRLAALLEIAESEFLDLKKSKMNYAQAVAVQVEANVSSLPLDALSLRAFIEQQPLVSEIDGSIAAWLGREVADSNDRTIELRVRVAKHAGLNTLKNLSEALNLYHNGILEYVRRVREFWQSYPRTTVQKGICVYHLSMMLISSRGENALLEAMKVLNFDVSLLRNAAGHVAVAQEIVRRYST